MAASLYETGMGAVQDVTAYWNPMKLKLAGPNVDLKNTIAASRDSWVPLMEELAIKYERWFAIGPEKRLLMMTVSMVMAVHRANSAKIPDAQQMQRPVDDSVQREADALFSGEQ